MGVFRLLLRLLVLLAALSLVAATSPREPKEPSPDRQPGDSDRGQPRAVDVQQWLQFLPAPAAPDDWTPAAGPRVAWPVRGILTQPFGCTGFSLERPAQDCPSGFHTGIDLAEPGGTPIHAAADGLAYPFSDAERYGNYVVIQHLAGYSTLYAHMQAAGVAWAQPVRAGDVIGSVGSTGNSSGPHLHFEVRFAGSPQDPLPYLQGSPPDPFTLPAGWPGAPRDDWRGIR